MAGSGSAHLRDASEVLLSVENLVVDFPVGRKRKVSAVANISFDIAAGETLGLVGESGCGKSTTGKAIMQLPRPTRGSVRLDGTDLATLSGEDLRRTRPRLQMIFQDPISSLNPRRTVAQIVEEPLKIWDIGTPAERQEKVAEVLSSVGIDPTAAGERKPHEFSGGQCQRISIARAVITEPAVIICDEPVSALDVSVQAQILNLLEDMKERYGLTLVFVAHDLAVVKNVSDRVAVMYLGKMCELGPPDTLYEAPAHHYTKALLSAIPLPDPMASVDSREHLGGELPSPIDPPSGCRFRTRCDRAEELCSKVEPQMQQVEGGHYVACHFPLQPVAVAAPTVATAASDG
jgi:peptide/nickel transport system ATP-binding protein